MLLSSALYFLTNIFTDQIDGYTNIKVYVSWYTLANV